MATKRFGGFTNDQQYTLLSKLGYAGPMQKDDMAKFMASNPNAAAKMVSFIDMAKKRVEGNRGMTPVGMATGGTVPLSLTSQEYRNIRKDSGEQAARDANAAREAEIAAWKPKPAPVAASTPKPIIPPTKTFPAIAAAPKPTKASSATTLATAKTAVASTEQLMAALNQKLASNPTNKNLQAQLASLTTRQTAAKANLKSAYESYKTLNVSTTGEVSAAGISNPTSLVTNASVANIPTNNNQLIAAGTGQVDPTGVKASASTVDASTATLGPAAEAAKYSATSVTSNVVAALDAITAATGVPSSDALAQAATMSEAELSSLGLSAAQITELRTVQPITPMSVTPEQKVEAASANLIPQGQAAQTQATSVINAVQGTVQGNELVDADTIKITQAVEAVAVTMSTLNTSAQTKVINGTLSANSFVVPAQGDIEAKGTVQGQLSELMVQFNDGTPAWAAGAMRSANAAMSARGLGNSSMAGAAIVQAAMESAMPIAQQDAQAFTTMNLANLNNRQQAALANAAASQNIDLSNLSYRQQAALQESANGFGLQSQSLSNEQSVVLANAQLKAALQGKNMDISMQSALTNAARYAEINNINLSSSQQALLQQSAQTLQIDMANLSSKQQMAVANLQVRAAIAGQELTNQQQANVLNAARVSEIANMNFTAEQQNAVENAKLAQTVDLANLSARQAKVMANAATLASMDMANLNNRQQTATQNAQAFLSMDMTNLNNAQQKVMFDAQATTQALFSDQAAANASKQFNATSENQTNQFFANLASTTSRFNTEQQNAAKMFNAGEKNAVSKFNAELTSQRQEFNATNSLVIAQANAQWRQTVSTTNTAQQNETNRINAAAANGFTSTAIDNLYQKERDLMAFAFAAAEGAAERASTIAIAQLTGDQKAALADGQGQGRLVASFINSFLDNWGST
jgi:hypothetical protein